MSKSVFLHILLSILLSSVAQIVLKAGMSNPAVTQSLHSGLDSLFVRNVASNGYVWLGLGLYFASAVVWLLVLARLEVSLAYPFVGLGFFITMLLGWLVHGDAISATRILGTLLIAGGVVLLARG